MVWENEDNPKALWNSTKKILHRSQKIVLLDHTTIISFTNTLGKYSANKSAKVRSALLSTDADPLSQAPTKIEKAVAKQINEHIAPEGILNINQSGYRAFHSTKTALLKIQNDIGISMDKGTAVGLVLLDLSTAFDTIDHSILFHCLQLQH